MNPAGVWTVISRATATGLLYIVFHALAEASGASDVSKGTSEWRAYKGDFGHTGVSADDSVRACLCPARSTCSIRVIRRSSPTSIRC
jgi:hypothetical protein